VHGLVAAVERVLREQLSPDKINLAAWAIWWPICTGT
jgi:hypothetical protein